MKKIVLCLGIIGIIGYGLFRFIAFTISPSLSNREITIINIKAEPRKYLNQEVELGGVEVIRTKNILNYSLSTICDKTDSIMLLSDNPYRKGEIINVKGYYKVLYGDGKEFVDVFVTKNFHPIKDLLEIIKEASLNNTHQ